MDDTVHATHTCYFCHHHMLWTGNILGAMTVSHGNEVDATLCVSRARDGQGFVELAVQLQCPKCGAVNQFKAMHKIVTWPETIL